MCIKEREEPIIEEISLLTLEETLVHIETLWLQIGPNRRTHTPDTLTCRQSSRGPNHIMRRQ